MAPTLFRGLKGVNISCTSPASTAICSNMEHQPSIYQQAERPQQTRHHKNSHKTRRALNTLPFLPSKADKQNSRKSSSDEKPTHLISPTSSSRYLLSSDSSSPPPSSFFDVYPDFEVDPVPDLIQIDHTRFHFGDGDGSSDLMPSASSFVRSKDHAGNYLRSSSTSAAVSTTWVSFDQKKDTEDKSEILRQSSSVAPPVHDQIGFRASTSLPSPRILDGREEEQEDVRNEIVLEKSIVGGGLKEQIGYRASTSSLSPARFQSVTGGETAVLKSSFSARSRDQVVDLRVSLHCKGCEGKVRKHLSRMQGVTSFSIDFAAKKVTVIGDVTPLGVLSSISKVKNAQLWSPPPTSKLH